MEVGGESARTIFSTEYVSVDAIDRHDAASSRCHKRLICIEQLLCGDWFFADRHARLARQLQDRLARNPPKTASVRGIENAVFYKEDIHTRSLGEIAIL